MNSRLLACLAADYGLNGTLQPLYSYQDLVCLLRTHDGNSFTVKMMHAGCDPNTVELQCAVLHHLEDGKGLPVPRVQCTLSGKAHTRLTDDDGATRLVWVVSYIPGVIAADYQPVNHDALYSMGRAVAVLSQSLARFEHPQLSREFEWKLVSADWVDSWLPAVQKAHSEHADWLASAVQDFRAHVKPALQDLSWQTVHGDLNDHNVVYSRHGDVCGLLDFGDAHQAPAVCDLAIAAAYFMMHHEHPVQALGDLVQGYHSVRALELNECALLYALIKMRLVQSLTCSFRQRDKLTGTDYHSVSEQPALDLINRLKKLPEPFIHESVSIAAGSSRLSEKWARCCRLLADNPPSPVIVAPWRDAEILELDAGSDGPVNPFEGIMTDPLKESGGAGFFIGRWGEPRLVYQAPLFKSGPHPSDDARTVHAGTDLFAPAGTPVCAPLDGHVHAINNHTQAQDYGPVIVLRHQLGDDQLFTLYGHLRSTCLEHLQVGDAVRGGQVFCHIGAPPENGDWPPHLHFQCVLEDCDWGTDIPGVSYDRSWSVWQRFFPNPAALLNLPDEKLAYPTDDTADLMQRRRQHLGKNLSVAYSRPLKIVRGWQQFLFDQRSRCYLDAYNNVPHVGHCHPRVVDAVARQMRKLSTNTRYLHDTIVDYAEELSAQFASPLDVCFFVNSASEANELALRLARAYTRAPDLIVMAGAYHGHTT
ncbi:MAG: aminotransferase class III-fold pyridoxal phosphate-dependent enzyme, partial [Gammaproteobacteria bacterium]|nr:aminotransferase class III-fold pyridoxal phosphate-dependent enzyme [Gammaproteobacteria bacterium]